MPYGYNGKILHVDLTHAALEVETPPESFYRKYLGGSAMGLVYILKEMTAGVAALAPENVLTLFTGVTTGAPISGQSRINANAKSPLTGAIGDAQGGGFFPAELKFAGFDGIVIKGRSPQPVVLTILNGTAELRPAAHLAGKTTGEVEELLKEELDDPRIEVLQHGPAAEKGVLFSSLVSMSNRNNGRTGMGLVMASKNLRAVAVRGRHPVEIADREALKALVKWGVAHMPDGAADFGKLGTPGVVNPQHYKGTLPTFNFNAGQFDQHEALSGEVMYDTILKERDTCFSCTIRCKRTVEIKGGPYPVDPLYGGPEYETLGTLGSYCGVSSLAAVSRANMLCNMHGVDTIAAGATIAFAMECFEKGIIGLEQTGGLELRFGSADAMLAALEQIVRAEGPLGSLLAQGSARAAEVWGPAARDCLITVKGSEAPAHMPQAKKSLALLYAVNPFGADHQSSDHDPAYERGAGVTALARLAQLDLQDPPAPGSLGPEKVRLVARTQLMYSLADSLELCQFVWAMSWTLFGPSELVELVRAVTGWQVSLYELLKVGERRVNLMRVFNAREGFDRRQDELPAKFFRPLGGTGPTAGVSIDRAEFEAARSLYYAMMGWTPEGTPTPVKLTELGLDWVNAQEFV